MEIISGPVYKVDNKLFISKAEAYKYEETKILALFIEAIIGNPDLSWKASKALLQEFTIEPKPPQEDY